LERESESRIEEVEMDVAIGLPNAVPGASGEQLVEWARWADARGFSSLGTIDRIAYGNYEPLVALAAAAAVTERIGLCTSVLLGPLRTNPTLLAKQALSLHAASGGRFTLGIGLGGREDDYEVSGVSMRGRGRALDAALERIKEVWEGEGIGPSEGGSPGLVVGGSVDASFTRAARFGDGWIAGGAPPEEYGDMAERARAAWSKAGRADKPRLMGLAYYSLGDDAEAEARAYLGDYYAFLGEQGVAYMATAAAKDAEAIAQRISAFDAAGCEELIFFPSSANADQVDLLAEAAGL
jgi:alkanesulfonate monooxygenase SsuD/methylene tetrahydromethanopterin reductase-like flavin-dependent oxidoreductase (luciferase family)